MRKFLVTAALVATTAAVMAVPAAANHSWGGYHWARTANPFTVQTGNNVSSDWTPMFNTTLSDWSASSVLNLTAVAGGTTGRKCRATLGRIEVCSAAYGKNGWLGLATISVSGGHITQGTTKVNDSYFTMSLYNNPNERQHVMCQEVGHDIGLGHTSEDGSSQNTCMDYFSNTGANAGSTLSTHPNAHDYAQLESIYAHLDSSTTIRSSLADDPNGKPYKTDRTDNRRASRITEHFPDDSKRITHITWAE